MPHAVSDERGFSLVELLVTILIIGILAAIALPSFLSQREKAQDADAKTNARQLVTHVESCYTSEQDYTKCGSSALTDTGLSLGSGRGQVDVIDTTPDTYVVAAVSRSGGTFTITRTDTARTRTCSGGTAGCNSGGSW
jgi:type IV pilus assembly protein PilA